MKTKIIIFIKIENNYSYVNNMQQIKIYQIWTNQRYNAN